MRLLLCKHITVQQPGACCSGRKQHLKTAWHLTSYKPATVLKCLLFKNCSGTVRPALPRRTSLVAAVASCWRAVLGVHHSMTLPVDTCIETRASKCEITCNRSAHVHAGMRARMHRARGSLLP
eukprot:366462-Chlamydomonas_euryale.AAC.31